MHFQQNICIDPSEYANICKIKFGGWNRFDLKRRRFQPSYTLTVNAQIIYFRYLYKLYRRHFNIDISDRNGSTLIWI